MTTKRGKAGFAVLTSIPGYKLLCPFWDLMGMGMEVIPHLIYEPDH